MLQDLDFLAARIAQLVKHTQQLQSQHAALSSRAEVAEQERDSLREKLARQETEFKDVAAQARQHEAELARVRNDAQSEIDAIREASRAEVDALRVGMEARQAEQQREAQAVQTRLEAELSDQKAAYTKIAVQLESSVLEAERLRIVANDARVRIDALLERLPGAPQE